jgi:biopolymer transport protein ExbD/biopolymer transport protein TolR
MAKKKDKTANVVADINVTPMVDVMLVLLIIFMVITPLLAKGITVDLVKTKNPISMQKADQDDAIIVAVARDGKTFLGSDQVPAADIPAKIADMLSSRLDKTCYVKADSRARYSAVVEVVDSLRSAGVDQIGMLVESENKQVNEGAAE